MTVRALSFHAGYRCRHTGACCTANWPIPVEADRLNGMRAAIANGRLQPQGFLADAVADAPPLLRIVDRQCVFHTSDAGGRCAVHTALGHDALPLACRQFPRIVVTDPRGVSVVLSHFCPTAARMLDMPGMVAISDSPDGFPASGEYVGLDARNGLPPLLRPDVLMDWESWWEFERRAVERIGNSVASPVATLAAVAQVIEDIRAWKPGDGPLLDRIRASFDAAPPQAPSPGDEAPAVRRMNRFLAAHAFGSWIAHLGGGLRTWVRSLEVARELAATRGFREADLQLRHVGDPWDYADRWSAAEGAVTDPARRFRRAGRSTRS